MPGRKANKNDLFNALGHPVRRQILREMLGTQEEVSPRQLAAKLSQELSALSYHVRVLDECDAVKLVRTGQVGGSNQHFYRVIVKADWALAALKTGEEPPPEKD
jgi:DNA-binding transcriptional ArsR family regulator